MTFADPKLAAFPSGIPETIPIVALYVGDRIDTRGFEPADALGLGPLALPIGGVGVAVVFRYGVVVLFNVGSAEERALFGRLSPHIVAPLPAPEIERARLQVKPDAEAPTDISGTILVRQSSTEIFQLVADVLAKNLVLAHYEARIAGIFDRIEPLAATLREKGRAGEYGRTLMRQIGDVLQMQHRMVGRVETDEKPEILWDHPEFDRLHLRLAEEYELRDRSRSLDRKLDVISRTVETLLGLVQNRTNLRVEWYILALIVAELILSIYPLVLH